MKNIGIIGFGQLGSSLYNFFSDLGFTVYFFDIIEFSDESFKHPKWMSDVCDIIYITTNTPSIDDTNYDYTSIDDNLSELNGYSGNIVISSTTSIGTMDILAKKHKLNLIYNPFMFVGGEGKESIKNTKHLLVGCLDESSELISFYRSIWEGVEYHIHSYAEAECIKLLHNYFINLKVNFSINVGLLSNTLGLDVDNVLASLKKFEIFNKANYLSMGLPVGGPCIPRDSNLIENVFNINGGILDKNFLLKKIAEIISELKNQNKLSAISILNKSYKKGFSNFENSTPIELGNQLKEMGEVIYYEKFDSDYLHVDVFSEFSNVKDYTIFDIQTLKIN